MILEDRYRVQEVKLATAQALTLECTDMALCRVVELRLIMEAEEAHAHVVELGVMATLADVPCVPDVYHFTRTRGPAVALPFSIMELLQGQTLAARFQEAQDPESARPLSPAEAAEISFALLRGVDECHQRKVLHLGLHPETVWISPSLSRAPVRILDWRGAQIFKGSGVLSNPEFMVAQEGKWRGKMNALPKLVRGDVEIPVSVLLQSSKSHEKPFPKLRVQSHGLPLYYMSAEQLNSVIVAYERRRKTQSHLWQHGDGQASRRDPRPRSRTPRCTGS
ncbi:unnamed protein product [Prorocentrum cordatum]|uniref:Protein kinase domain-containing protein n=1 Tax=Prorocentrum cordatum TaxID=2364126 RepID=A0ABN9UTG9_9DINO|nr:unnamed protein product [Polarella glacialis]